MRLRARQLTAVWTLAVAAACGDATPTDAKQSAPIRASATKPAPSAPPVELSPMTPMTPSAFLGQGTPTFILGTAGSDTCDRANRGQARFIAGLLFPDAPLINDIDVDPKAWPALPVLYGAPACHSLLATVAETLPLEFSEETLSIGERRYEGAGVQVVTVVPESSGDGGHPAFLLYAGIGDYGAAEINALTQGQAVIDIGDAHGLIASGTWTRSEAGATVASLGPDARRVKWRSRTDEVQAPRGPITITSKFVEMLPAAETESDVIEAIRRGVGTLVRRGGLQGPATLQIFVYPDEGSKRSLTGKPGDGHATPAAHALHIVADKSRLPLLEPLVAHEGTHVLGRAAWGAPGTALWGEGIAVWVAGQYAGTPVSGLGAKTSARPVADLLGRGFFTAGEADRYAYGAILADVAINEVGLAKVTEHLYPASPADWAAACETAGTTADALQVAVDQRLATK